LKSLEIFLEGISNSAKKIIYRGVDQCYNMEKLERLASFFDALRSPTRLKILQVVAETDRPLHIEAVAKMLGINYAAIYRHIQALRQQGLLKVYEVGRSRVLALTRPQLLRQLLELADKFLSEAQG